MRMFVYQGSNVCDHERCIYLYTDVAVCVTYESVQEELS